MSADFVAHYFGGQRPPLQSFADDGNENSPPMRRAPVFEEKNALPCAELHMTIDNRNGFARARERHPDVRGAVVTAFGRVDEIICVFGDEVLEEFFKIFSRRAIGVFHNDQTATRMLDEYRDDSRAHTGFADLALDFIGNLICAFAFGGDFESVMMDAHTES
jgi:hypothetical protein